MPKKQGTEELSIELSIETGLNNFQTILTKIVWGKLNHEI